MNVKLYSFAKRRNSTLRPNVAAGYDFEAIVNDAQTTICNPQLTLKGDAQSVLPSFNYVYINKWNRYYYISDWRYMGNGLWVAYCNVDVLASWKEAIIATGGYVGRWVWSDNVSVNVHDGYYPATGYYKAKKTRIALPFSANPTQGSYVIGVIGGNSNYGSVTYYAVTASAMATLIENLAGTESLIIWNGIESVTSSIIKSLTNPIQYVTCCKWYPFAIGSGFGTTERIRLWTWDTGVDGIRLSSSLSASMRVFSVTYDDYFNPAATGEGHSGNFPKYAPYWVATLYTPIWGSVDIPVEMLETRPHYTFDIHVNIISGMADLKMYANTAIDANDEIIVLKRTTQMAIDIPLAQLSMNYVEMAKDVVQMTAAGAMDMNGAYVGDGSRTAPKLANGIINAVTDALSPSLICKAGGGGFNYDIDSLYIQHIRYETVGEDFPHMGVPCKKLIQNLSGFVAEGGGYVQFDDVHFKSTATDNENAEVEEAMKGGIFIE